jgi:hypothetical protein
LSGTIQRHHQLAMRQKCLQTLLRRHATQLRGQIVTGSFGKQGLHGATL